MKTLTNALLISLMIGLPITSSYAQSFPSPECQIQDIDCIKNNSQKPNIKTLHSFTGNWASSYDNVYIVVNGNKAVGYNDYSGGIYLEGIISDDGQTLSGRYYKKVNNSPDDRGTFTFRLSANGLRWQGTWQDSGNMTGNWTANRVRIPAR